MYRCAHKTATLTPIQHTVPPPRNGDVIYGRPLSTCPHLFHVCMSPLLNNTNTYRFINRVSSCQPGAFSMNVFRTGRL